MQNYLEKLRDGVVSTAYKPQRVNRIPDRYHGTVRELLNERDERNLCDEVIEQYPHLLRLPSRVWGRFAAIFGADLFAFLLELNDARRAVAQNDDLRDRIMHSIDTAAIQAEIEQLETEKRQLDDELAELNSLKQQLPDSAATDAFHA